MNPRTQTMVSDYASAQNPLARKAILTDFDSRWIDISDDVAVELYGVDPGPIVEHLIKSLDGMPPWDGGPVFPELLAAMEAGEDPAFHELRRRTISVEEWEEDVLLHCGFGLSAAGLLEELELRHPTALAVHDPALVFKALLEHRGEDVLPYVMNHVREFPGSSPLWYALLEFAAARGWWDLWRAIATHHVDREQYRELLRGLLNNRARPEAEIIRRVSDMAGAHFHEWDAERREHVLDDETALLLYTRFPELAQGLFAGQFLPRPTHWANLEPYVRTAQAALAAGDATFYDFLTGRMTTATKRYWGENDLRALEPYVTHYRTLQATPTEFARRAARTLGHAASLDSKRTRRLGHDNPIFAYFVADPALYLTNSDAIRELLEAPAAPVRELGLKILALDDERAAQEAVRNVDLLLATPLDKLSRAGHVDAFRAMEVVAARQLSLGPIILARLREAADLLEPTFPRAKLIATIARLLKAHPNLRVSGESPVIYGAPDDGLPKPSVNVW